MRHNVRAKYSRHDARELVILINCLCTRRFQFNFIIISPFALFTLFSFFVTNWYISGHKKNQSNIYLYILYVFSRTCKHIGGICQYLSDEINHLNHQILIGDKISSADIVLCMYSLVIQRKSISSSRARSFRK